MKRTFKKRGHHTKRLLSDPRKRCTNSNKIQYKNGRIARNAAMTYHNNYKDSNYERPMQEAYQCRNCNKWHLSTPR